MRGKKMRRRLAAFLLALALVCSTVTCAFASGDILSLYKNKHTDNSRFEVQDMLPGDEQTKDFCVRVSYNGTITVHFKADNIRAQYGELQEVLECKVSIDGSPVYNGLLRDMHDIPYTITGVRKTQDIDYKVTVFLDTSVGNEYQRNSLTADLVWWAETEEDDNPGGSGGGGGGGGLPVGPDTPINPPVDPDTPGGDPDVPDVPGEDPDVPGEDPDTPDIPGGDTDIPPADGADVPSDKPDAPGDLPESADKPAEPSKPTGELIAPPNTGDFKNPAIYIAAICISLFIIFLILFVRKKTKNEKNRTVRRLMIALAVVIILAVCLCVTTFALIYSIVSVDENIFSTGTVKINLNDEKPIITADEFLFEPGMTVRKRFFIENESSDRVYYKIYFDNIDGDLADVLDVTISYVDGGNVLYSGKARNLTIDNSESAILNEDERHYLYVTFHFPEESGNDMQNAFLQFDMSASATQWRHNPNIEF